MANSTISFGMDAVPIRSTRSASPFPAFGRPCLLMLVIVLIFPPCTKPAFAHAILQCRAGDAVQSLRPDVGLSDSKARIRAMAYCTHGAAGVLSALMDLLWITIEGCALVLLHNTVASFRMEVPRVVHAAFARPYSALSRPSSNGFPPIEQEKACHPAGAVRPRARPRRRRAHRPPSKPLRPLHHAG